MENDLEEAEGKYKYALPTVYMACKEAELKLTGQDILGDVSSHLLIYSAMQEAAEMPLGYPGMRVEKV